MHDSVASAADRNDKQAGIFSGSALSSVIDRYGRRLECQGKRSFKWSSTHQTTGELRPHLTHNLRSGPYHVFAELLVDPSANNYGVPTAIKMSAASALWFMHACRRRGVEGVELKLRPSL
eukprot:3023431-Rhodomonas_salina.7